MLWICFTHFKDSIAQNIYKINHKNRLINKFCYGLTMVIIFCFVIENIGKQKFLRPHIDVDNVKTQSYNKFM